MKYLLLGNGEIDDGADFPAADCVVQFNLCRHRARVPAQARRYVFISNTGSPTERSVAFILAERDHPALRGAVIVCARNPLFYRLKQAGLRLRRAALWRDFTLSDAPRRLGEAWRVETIGFWNALGLEWRMRREGMPAAHMPSTGMIAFDWARRRMRSGDSLELAGFAWKGWEGHPWEIERRLMEPEDSK